MHAVLDWKIWLTATWILCAAIVGLWFVSGADLVAALRSGVSTTSVLVTLFVVTPAWRILWFIPWFRNRAPLLDGRWTGVVQSNFSILESVKAAARQDDAPSVDLDSLHTPLPDLKAVEVTATIESSFFGISMELETAAGRYQTSTLKSVQLTPAKGNISPVLRYIFEGRVLTPKLGDVPTFNGAASLTVRADLSGNLVLEGSTWTNRAWDRGLNTAGVVRFVRTSAARGPVSGVGRAGA